jgi:hypothetical protein
MPEAMSREDGYTGRGEWHGFTACRRRNREYHETEEG